ncbi:ankyrin repeat and LEM domain-containing protein 1 isoform X3 [Cygnus olor]|uniref:ankyrin repeat and LEM domain-containing protein 1 isoform X3 n=1 Tax=Cygnus olor TaxID=8869 RepID=UPI001ADE885B|nr:ankyrin repeat and LEM domain-containing protein 1 isoform X3 [Cygnus olor]
MNGAGRREPAGGLRAPFPEELPPLRVAASQGCCRCLEVLLKTGGYPELRDQDGKRAIDLALQRGCRLRVLLLRDSLHVQGWPPAGDKPPLGCCCGCFRGAAAAPLGGPDAEPHPDPAAPWGPRCSLSFLTEGCSEDDRSDAGPLSSTRLSQLGELELGNSQGSGEPPAWPGCPLPSSVPSLPLWPPRGSAFPPQPLASSTLLCAGDEPGQGPLRGTGTWGGPKPSTGARSPPRPLGAGGRDCSSLGDEDGSTASECFITAMETLEPSEQRSPATEATSPGDPAVPKGRARTPRVLSDEALRRRLRVLGEDPGPITEFTRRVYLRRLEKLSRSPEGHSPELAAALQTGHVPDCAQDERVLAQQFDRPDRSRHWREGLLKASFNYLLLDPRVTQDLPLRCHRLSPAECFRTFVKAVFYVGKGTRARPYCHLSEALSQYRAGTRKGCPKVRRILEIWASGQGVISVHCFQSSVPAEAYTRESCVVEALGLRTITNQRKGNCYGAAVSWPPERRRRLGVHMLHRAMRIFLAEGERQLRPADIQAGR